MEKKAAHGKVRKVRGKDLWYINYCYSGRRDAVRFGKSDVQDGKYICYAGAYCWYTDSFEEAVETCRKKAQQLGGLID
ncbi:MAG: hypothetical protein IKW79_06925 [Schwartzia sp.]|nr:hypothetical protein [Schwartzia sp. (in: firmicutes)]